MVVTFIPCQLITGWKLKTRKLVFRNVCPSSPCVKIGTQCVNGLEVEKISWWGSISRHILQKLENIPRQSWCHLWPPSKSSGCLSPRNCIQLFMDKTGQFSWIDSTLGFLLRQVSSTKLVSIGSASPARLIRRDKDRLALRPPLGPEHLANFQRRSSVLPWQDELDCNIMDVADKSNLQTYLIHIKGPQNLLNWVQVSILPKLASSFGCFDGVGGALGLGVFHR